MVAQHENLQALYVDQLRDLYSAEQQILDALPKMVKRSTHRELQNALDQHRVVTEHQTLNEEREANETLMDIAESVVNPEAMNAEARA